MFDALLDLLAGAYQWQRQRGLLTALHEQERWFDTPHQTAAAEITRQALHDAGLVNARLEPFAADGRTRYQDWMTRLAWECPSATLAVTGGPVLADRATCPQAVPFGGGPLAQHVRPGHLPRIEPVTAAVIDADTLPALTPAALAGKYVLTSKYLAEFKRLMDATGAAGGAAAPPPAAIISDFVGPGIGYTEHTTRWVNDWSSRPGGWYFHADERPLAGFCLSPAAGKLLRARLAAEPGLTLTGHCASRLYEGQTQCPTAVLEGTDPRREIWLYAHACEGGADDNCSGVAVSVEALHLLHRLILAGKLPRPRHSIRFIATEECLGMVAFATLHEDLRRRALAGLNMDNVGNASFPDRPFHLEFGSLANPSIAWPVAGLLAEALAARGGYHVQQELSVLSADDMIADPNCGVPSVAVGAGKGSPGYHSSSDTPEVIADDSMRANTLLAAGWAYALASLDDAAAGKLAAPAADWLERHVARGTGVSPVRPMGVSPMGRSNSEESTAETAVRRMGETPMPRTAPLTPAPLPRGEGATAATDGAGLRRWAAGRAVRDLGRWGIDPRIYEAAATRFAPAADAAPLPDLPTAGPRYRRTTWGTCTYETLSPAQYKGLGRWSSWQNAALYWTDGRRPLAALQRLVAAEVGKCNPAGLEKLVQANLVAGLMEEARDP